MADYKGKFTGQQVDDTLQQAIDDHKKVAELEQKVNNLSGGGGIDKTSAELLGNILKSALYSSNVDSDIELLIERLKSNQSGGNTGEDTPQEPTEDKYYSIEYNLTDTSSSDSSSLIKEGNPYSCTLIANDGYVLSSVSVIMDGIDVTNEYNNNGVIEIPSVNGNIVITAISNLNSVSYVEDGLISFFDSKNRGDDSYAWKDTLSDSSIILGMSTQPVSDNGGFDFSNIGKKTFSNGNLDTTQTIEIVYKDVDKTTDKVGLTNTKSMGILIWGNRTYIITSKTSFNCYSFPNEKLTNIISVNNSACIINGVSVGKSGVNNNISFSTNTIGSVSVTGTTPQAFKGIIYAVRFYNRELTEAEMIQNQQSDIINYNLNINE